MKKEYDLSKLKERLNTHDPSAVKTAISLRLDGSLLAQLKEEGQRLGLPYQTLIQSILYQYINGELVSSKLLGDLKKSLSA